MSICMQVNFNDFTQEDHFYTVVTDQDYEAYWKPIAQLYDLRYVLALRSPGLLLKRDPDVIAPLSRELGIVKANLLQSDDSEIPREYLIVRIDRTIDELEFIKDNLEEIKDAYIG